METKIAKAARKNKPAGGGGRLSSYGAPGPAAILRLAMPWIFLKKCLQFSSPMRPYSLPTIPG
jgi:hypothetical protein